MTKKTPPAKERIRDAAIRLLAQRGVDGTSMRAIAREVGLTEGALYRHYAGKEALCCEAFSSIVVHLAAEKEHLFDDPRPIRERLHEWVRLTFSYYDRNPEAFTYVLLGPPAALANCEVMHSQGELFKRMIDAALQRGEVRPMSPDLALSHFTGLMLNVPRLINEGTLAGPAEQYANEVARAVWCVLAPPAATPGADGL